MIQSPVKSVKALRGIYGKLIFVIVSVYQGKFRSNERLIFTSQIFLPVSQCPLKLIKFFRSQKYYVSNFAPGTLTINLLPSHYF